MRSLINRLSKERITWIILGTILLIGLVVTIAYKNRPSEKETATPVFVAVMLEKKGTVDSPFQDSVDAQRGAQICAEQINQDGLSGSNGRLNLNLDFYYDEGDLETAKSKVNEMLMTNRALAVVGHALSQISVKTGEIYKAEGIPAITASSVNDEITRDNDWYFRALPSSSMQSEQMAQYIYNALNSKQVSVIELEPDSFAQQFSTGFQTSFRRLGGQISGHYTFPPLSGNELSPEMIQIINQLEQANRTFTLTKDPTDDPGVIVFAMRAKEAALFIMEMRDRGFKNILFGPSAFANKQFLETFESSLPGKDISPYSNGVYALAPVVYDTAGDIGQEFLKSFREKYGDTPGMKAATNCDSLRILAQAMVNAKISGDPQALKDERRKLHDALAKIDTPAEAVDGVTGQLYFNSQRNPVKPIDVSIYQNGERISAISQFVEIDRNTYARLDAQTQEMNPILKYDKRYFRITDVVYVGVDINEVSELDIQEGTYILDYYVWFRSREPMNPQDFDFIPAAEDIEFGDPVVETVENGISYRAYHVKAKFKFKGDVTFKSYPFDNKTLGFEIKHQFKNAQELLLVPDTIGMRGITDSKFIERLTKQNVIGALGGEWGLGGYAKIGQEKLFNNSTLGNPDLVSRDTSIPYSRFIIEFEIKRNGINYSLKNFLPMMFLVGLALLAFFSGAKDYGKMYDVVTSVILTAAFFQLGLSDSLPNIGYTTAMDWMFYLVYFLCVLQIAIILVIKRYVDQGREIEAERIVLISRFAYLALVLLGGYLVYFIFWRS